MLNSISRACIQQAAHAGSLYVTTTISVGNKLGRWVIAGKTQPNHTSGFPVVHIMKRLVLPSFKHW